MSIDAISVLCNTIISQTQQIAQAVNTLQVVACSNIDSKGNKICGECLKGFNKPSDRIRCSAYCTCNIKDVDLSQVVVVKFDALLSINSNTFYESFMNNLYLSAKIVDTGLPGLNPTTASQNEAFILQKVTQILNTLKTDSVQSSLQGLQQEQVVIVKGPGTSIGLNLKQAVNYISSVIINNTDLYSVSLELQTLIENVSTKLILTATDAIIVSIIMVLAIGVAILLVYFAVKSILEILAAAS